MKFVFFLLLFLFSVNGWAACAPYTAISESSLTCYGRLCVGLSVRCPTIKNAVLLRDNSNECQINESSSCQVIQNFDIRCFYNKCDTKCEADSLACINQGFQWNSANCECLGDDGCSDLRSECESMGGRFTGTVVSDNGLTCCRSSCNVCGGGAMKNLYNAKSKLCCDNGQAPPDSNQTCQTVGMPTSGCGMVVSSYGDFTSGGWQCGDPSTSFEAAQRYRQQCLDGSSSSGPNSSGGSSGGSSGNQDCQECPYLEAILDTLTRQKHKVDDIYDCITRPGFCGEQQQKDSLTFPDWVETKMNKIIEFDSTNVQATKSVDSVLKRVLVTDSAILNSDSLTRLAIVHGVDSLVNAIKNSSGGDSLGEYIDRIANLLGLQTITLSHHLDSILNHIPNDILDSIYKYQKTSLDFFDSSFYVFGEGFGKIDNLTDSAIKYFRQGFHYDSVYSSVYRDSLGEIHEAIDGISTSIGYDMGYGDTASKNLRDDLENITGVLQGVSDSLNKGSYDTNSTYNGYLTGYDTAAVQFATNLGNALGGALHDSTYKGIFVRDSSTLGGDTAYRLPNADSLHQVLQNSNDSMKSALADTMQTWFNELRNDFMLVNFDSAIIAPLGAKVPNTNTCPADCFKIDLSSLGGVFSGVREMNWGICEARIGPLNVLQFIRLILRIVTALTCIYIGLWIISGRKS